MHADSHPAASGSSASIQALKGLACLFVVAYHVVGNGQGSGIRVSPDSLLFQFSQSISLLRMPLFTFLSGVVYAMRPVVPGTLGPFLGKKALRLYVPAIVVGLLYFAATNLVMGGDDGGTPHGVLGVLGVLFFPYAHFWFLQALLVIIVVVGVAEVCGLMSTPRRMAAVLLATFLVHHFGNSNFLFFSIGRASYLLPFFVLGVAVMRFGGQLQWSRPVTIGLLCAFAATMVLHVAGVTGIHGAPLSQRSFLALLLSCSGLLLLWRFMPPVHWLARIGAFSFAIYLYHVFFTSGSRMLLGMLDVDAVPLLFVSGLVAGIAGSILVQRVAERLPWPLPLALIGQTSARRVPAAEAVRQPG